MTTSLNIIMFSIVIYGLVSCGNANMQATDQNAIIPTDTILGSSVTQQTTIDTIKYDQIDYPVSKEFQIKVLTIGNFHEDEVWQNASKEKWVGLFKSSKGFYIQQTAIKTRKVHDAIVDGKESEKTGWEVSSPNKDSNYLLVEALPFLQSRNVPDVPLPKKHIYPEDTLKISFLGTDYKLFATGGKKKIQEDPEAFDVWNYKLYLTANLKGKQTTQLLVAQSTFDDKMIEIIFAGDIDGDGALDLIIDTSRHYNMLIPTLYLSKPADSKQLLKPVGAHTITGC